MKEMKTLCKAKKSSYEDRRAEIVEAVSQPKHIREKWLDVAVMCELLYPCRWYKWKS